MDYSSLILMERDDATGFVTKELGSYKVSEGAEHIKGFYVKGDDVYIKFDTNKKPSKDYDYLIYIKDFNILQDLYGELYRTKEDLIKIKNSMLIKNRLR